MLRTPRPGTPGVYDAQVSFLPESPELHAITGEYDQSSRGYDDRVSAAFALAGLVRRSLRFASDSPESPLLAPGNLSNDQTTNCYGYSIVLSEVLESAEIPHSVVVANQHAFIAMADKATNSTIMVDTPTRQFYSDISGAFKPELSDNPQTAVLDSSVIIRQSGYADKSKTVDANPWLSFTNQEIDIRCISEQRLVRDQLLMARIFSPEHGREVLEAYSRFRHLVKVNSAEQAYSELTRLKEAYPDIDRRNRLSEPRGLVKRLGELSLEYQALDTIEIVKSSTQPFSEDFYFKLWPIDMQYKLARQTRNSDLLKDSLDQYNELYESTTNPRLKRQIKERLARRTTTLTINL